jgi:hypothetical protein
MENGFIQQRWKLLTQDPSSTYLPISKKATPANLLRTEWAAVTRTNMRLIHAWRCLEFQDYSARINFSKHHLSRATPSNKPVTLNTYTTTFSFYIRPKNF